MFGGIRLVEGRGTTIKFRMFRALLDCGEGVGELGVEGAHVRVVVCG